MDPRNETPVKHATPVSWALVANMSRARLFAGRIGSWELVESFDHMVYQKRSVDVLAEPNPRRAATPQFPAGVSVVAPDTFEGPRVEAETKANEFEALRFARELAARLERGVTDRSFGDLIIVAPLGFLASLRRSLSLEVQRSVETYTGMNLKNPSDDDAKRLLDAELTLSTVKYRRAL